MPVNERLFSAGLLDRYDEAVTGGNLEEISCMLALVGLRQDGNGMNWSVENDA